MVHHRVLANTASDRSTSSGFLELIVQAARFSSVYNFEMLSSINFSLAWLKGCCTDLNKNSLLAAL